MRVFVTGASGFVGSAVVEELLSAGHHVTGLVRSDAAAQTLVAIGAEVHWGTLEDLEALRRGAAASDGVIHTAFNHDFSRFAENCELDRRAIEALGEALGGTTKPLLVTAGLALVALGRVATEEDSGPAVTATYPRASELAAAALAARGVRASAVRLPPSVHGDGDHGFVPMLIAIAREKRVSAFTGDGLNLWSAVHRRDAAQAFRLALEHGATSARYHAVAEEGVPFRDIAEAIGRHLRVPVVAKSAEESAEHFGWFSMFASMDARASSAQTRETLGWAPGHKGLLADMQEGDYFS